MSRLNKSLGRTDGAIRELTRQYQLYRNRIARRSGKNTALAEQAAQLLPSANAALDGLVKYHGNRRPPCC